MSRDQTHFDELDELDELCVNTIRFLAADAVEKAGSGHPGMPLGAAPMAYVLWDRFLKHDPRSPDWPDRDRFVLSAGHGSALLYSLLHLTGYDLPLDELKRFRQWGSRTPGHPEYGHTPGVEATTGPLGQGFGMGVGMAMGERFLAQCFNIGEFELVDHETYAIVSDGDLMEGIASEAASLAGTLGLGRLVYLYDDNHISIEGETDLAFREDVRRRFEAHGWHVQRVEDGNDLSAIAGAIQEAKATADRPSLIMVRTRIGYGSPKQDTAEVHGSPLGEEALAATKERFDWPDESFHIPDEAREHMRAAVERGRSARERWNAQLAEYGDAHPDLADRFHRQARGELPERWEDCLPRFEPEDGPMATRSASGQAMNAVTERLPELVGGSADLAPSTKTQLIGYGDLGFGEDCVRNIHFGVREHAMGAAVNGMALHGGVIPYGATFLVFSDYMRPSLRLAALMGTHVIQVFTHDSIGLGEDGPTHQPVEHLASLRAIPGFVVLRPADANETAAAWQVAVELRRPTALVLTRQKLPVLDPEACPIAEGVRRGAYILADADGRPDLILLATGSEVSLALEARAELRERHQVRTRVVSMPSWELFEEQPDEYRERVLPAGIRARLAIEAAAPQGWHRWVGDAGDVIAVTKFGASAPGAEVFRHYGFTVENVVERARALVADG